MRVTNEELVVALFSNPTNRKAAEAVGLTERNFYKRTREPAFKAELAAAKRQLLEHAVAVAESRLNAALGTVFNVMVDTNNAASVRVQAADSLVRHTLKLIELHDVSERIDELEDKLNKIEQEGGANR